MRTWESLVRQKKGVYKTNEGWILYTTFKIRPKDLPFLVKPFTKIGEMASDMDNYYGGPCWLMNPTQLYMVEAVDNIAMTAQAH
jgi:hypothetical protein